MGKNEKRKLSKDRIMRKAQKRQAESFLEMLDQAHRKLKKGIVANQQEAVYGILLDCQQGAALLGGQVEEAMGGGLPVVALLEQYCEYVYRVYERAASGDAAGACALCGRLDLLLAQIRRGLREDIPERLEVVFFPYKASMWDSLESVWRAASQDPACNVYVVPIPYYDKSPDGSFLHMHYEGGLYPDDVAVTDYRRYDLAERRPDIIFIHNPYDDCNYVTSVAPQYYSKTLKKYTKNLVYIPYFLLDEIRPDDKQAVAEMEHFFTCPGVMHADLVFVQSEQMRRAYIDVMTRFSRGCGYTRKDWEKKIVGAGSPKVDKILQAQKKQVHMPKEWLRLIQRPDGKRKKVVFYNTSVSSFLQHNEQMLSKIRDVFSEFEKKQEEVALLWRPHPLIQATLKSMRPKLWQEYEKMVASYKTRGFGIYDDSPDLDRAICMSDAYYGDGSSLVWLCKSAGVPVLIQDMEQGAGNGCWLEQLLEKKGFTAVEQAGGRLYFTQLTGNDLISYDMQSKEWRKEAEFFGEPQEEANLFSEMIAVEDRFLFFIPRRAEAIYEYDTQSRQMKRYGLKGTGEDGAPLDGNRGQKRIAAKFSGAVLEEGRILLFPRMYPDMVVFHLETRKVTYVGACFDYLRRQQRGAASGKVVWGRQSCMFDGRVYLPVIGCGCLLKYDLRTGACAVEKIGQPEMDFDWICSDGSAIWMLARKHACMVKWDPKTGSKKVIRDFPEQFCPGNGYDFVNMVDCGDFLLCYPRQANMVLRVDKANGRISDVTGKLCRHWKSGAAGAHYLYAKEVGDRIYAVQAEDGVLQITRKADMETLEIPLRHCHGFAMQERRRLGRYWMEREAKEILPLSESLELLASDADESAGNIRNTVHARISECNGEVLKESTDRRNPCGPDIWKKAVSFVR